MSILHRNTLPFGCSRRTQLSQGFTMVELIVVIGVLAVLTMIGMESTLISSTRQKIPGP